MLLKISQTSQENTCTRVFFSKVEETLAQTFSCEFCKILKNNFFYRTPLGAASPNRGYLHCAILKDLHAFKEKDALRHGTCVFFFKMFQMRFSRFSKCLKTTWNSPEQPAELTKNKQQRQKHHAHNIPILSLLLVIIMV